MRAKVSCAIMVYNGETYHNGDYLEIENDSERQTLIRERCIAEIPEKKVVARSNIGTKGGRK